MKKVLCLVFAFILCLLLAACGTDKTDTQATEKTAAVQAEITETQNDVSEKIPETEVNNEKKESGQPDASAVDKGEWIKAYRDVLLSLDKQDIELYDQSPKFCLCYIDDNDVPELVISLGDFHAAGCYVFTFADGRALNLGPFGEFGAITYIEKSGLIIDRLGNNGYFVETYYRLDGGALDSALDFEIETLDGEKYMSDGKEITKAQYDSLVSKLTGGAKTVSSPGYEKCFPVSQESVDNNLR